MEENYVWYTIEEDTTYTFQLQRGVLASSPIVENTVGRFLLSGLSNVEHLKGILQRFGLTAAADYFAAHVATGDNVRIGDFGEVVAGHLLEEAEGVVRPIDKLRYRESPDWPMKLTDVFCVRVDGGHIVSFIFGEAKAGTTRPNSVLGQKRTSTSTGRSKTRSPRYYSSHWINCSMPRTTRHTSNSKKRCIEQRQYHAPCGWSSSSMRRVGERMFSVRLMMPSSPTNWYWQMTSNAMF